MLLCLRPTASTIRCTPRRKTPFYNALVTYVIPGSPAEEAGLRRGDWIMQVDTIRLMRDNSEELLSAGGPRRLLLGRYVSLGEGRVWVRPLGGCRGRPRGRPALGPWRDRCRGALPQRVLAGRIHHRLPRLQQLLGRCRRTVAAAFPGLCQPRCVGDLVLDLRYNEGGTSGSLQLLASLLAPSDAQGRVLASLQYNRKKGRPQS